MAPKSKCLAMVLEVSVLFSLLLSVASQVQVCDIEDTGNVRENVFNFGGFSAQRVADEMKVIFPAVHLANQGVIRLVEIDEDGGGGVTGTTWFTEKQRIGDGFIAEFQFSIRGAGDGDLISDGIAFVAQNDRIENIQGGIGENLGYRSGLNKYMAVAFDICADRENEFGPTLPCVDHRVRIDVAGAQEGSNINLIDDPVGGGLDLQDGVIHTGKVSYLASTKVVKVYIDDLLQAQVTLPEALEDFWGDKFAYFGFTASNMDIAPANVNLLSFRLDQLKSATGVISGLSRKYDFGQRVSFILGVFDTCNTLLGEADALTFVQSANNITASLTFQGDDDLVLNPTIQDREDGTYGIFFDLPQNVVGSWTLEIRVNNILTQDMPLANAVSSVVPTDGGLSTQNLIILCVIIALLVMAMAYWINRLNRYKKKLAENKENIDMGKVAHKIADIDKDVTYNMNPMLGTLDEMKEKLAKNEKILAQFGAGETMDENFTIDQLEDENRKLRDEMRRLKKEEAEAEAMSGAGRKVGPRKKKNIREFDQQQA
uniref:L-type lectin-like domain-containing protein n=1 Tax=Aplanochytrium stocchinoi TaxID=215587 RepID=A0A7S3PRH6_9STRA|mmetsp:Transcript_16346/g.19496  ORF Transcript_16346/g.19496 Transcript_16346/m.19496 type:complete len:542 (-) Transcript_16346:172-1797(-)|eukprot:CAMPEP_0204836144 /NCGR_PEP_ID=MMETSP1346-20131115/24271_1 /ASSEMBLY_ACC=CAM_ASM_000771 /TAXON_ID=215587 /ORGANISM="Aplanochytrium stocchinoi, Strain GSBS06" /LENGTH=541 /DNA_ID=CAMNT_0051970621 /DNA_START=258 /DNA_END=1883 /DNA_ORIENTATION=+